MNTISGIVHFYLRKIWIMGVFEYTVILHANILSYSFFLIPSFCLLPWYSLSTPKYEYWSCRLWNDLFARLYKRYARFPVTKRDALVDFTSTQPSPLKFIGRSKHNYRFHHSIENILEMKYTKRARLPFAVHKICNLSSFQRSRVRTSARSHTFNGDLSWNNNYGRSLPSAYSNRTVVSYWRNSYAFSIIWPFWRSKLAQEQCE